jgi:hypothetical protein
LATTIIVTVVVIELIAITTTVIITIVVVVFTANGLFIIAFASVNFRNAELLDPASSCFIE